MSDPHHVAVLFMMLALASGCRSPYAADRGAAMGGLTGAGVGALVGGAHGRPAAGAIVGSAVGALTGAAVGSEIDAVEAQQRAWQAQQQAQAVSLQDVVAMSEAGLGSDVIVQHLRTHGVANLPTATDLIWLKKQGVSDAVLQALQQPPSTASIAVRPPGPRPVVIEEHYYGAPPPRVHGHLHLGHPPHRYHRRPGGVRWGVSLWQ